MTPIPLREIVRRRSPRLRRLRLRPIHPTASQEKDLAAIYLRCVRIWERGRGRIVEEYARQLPLMGDGMTRDNDWLRSVVAAIVGEVAAELTFWEVLLQGWASEVVRWHTRRIVANLKYASNVDLGDMLSERDVADTVEAVIARNVALIRDVSEQTQARISDIVFRGLTAQTPTRDVARQINTATGMARKRSLRIAMDQTNKLSAALDRQRLRHLGFDGIEWRHSHKRNFRPEHKARDGKFFRWDDPVMKTDPPGHAPFCGCVSIGAMDLTDGE